jgi:hypothetical protein
LPNVGECNFCVLARGLEETRLILVKMGMWALGMAFAERMWKGVVMYSSACKTAADAAW